MSTPVLEVNDLVVDFSTEGGTLRAVDGISFSVAPGETLGIVGESGCGKSVTSLAIMGLLPAAGRITGGTVRYRGRNLAGLPESRMRRMRGPELAMIFQEPMTALNPVYTIGRQMTDILHRHQKLTRRQARAASVEMLAKVRIPMPDRRFDEYPHELSGGMRQRVMIAMALSCSPGVLVADEPTTALDVTTQAQVLEQIVRLQSEFGSAVLLITHDLGVVAETCDRALVMYCGSVVEEARVTELFRAPRHPYTRGLLDSIPRIRSERPDRLPVIPGTVPDLANLPAGCRYADRCPRVQQDCRVRQPGLRSLDESRVACYHPLERP